AGRNADLPFAELPGVIDHQPPLAVGIESQQVRKAVAIRIHNRAAKSKETRWGGNERERRKGSEFPTTPVHQDLVAFGPPQRQIETTVVVEIRNLYPVGNPLCKRPSSLGGPAHKLVLTQVGVEQGRAVVAEQAEVGVAVVIEVREDGAAHASPGGSQPCGGCDLGEGAIAVFAIEVRCG